MDTSNIDIFVYTEREGALSAVGHDLKLRVAQLDVDRDGDDVHVTVKSNSLEVDACIVDGGEKPVSAGDRKKIEKNAAKDVLQASKYPEVVFDGQVEDETDDSFRVSGDLTVAGRTRPFAIEFRQSGGQWRGEAVLHQPDWGIKPYRAMLGALKVKADVRIEVVAQA